VAWPCDAREASTASRVSVTRMLVVLDVGKLTTAWALVELALSIPSAVEAFVEVQIWEVGFASAVSVKEAHNRVPMAIWRLLSPIMARQCFSVQSCASFLRSYLKR
jgi:hypothetical protein